MVSHCLFPLSCDLILSASWKLLTFSFLLLIRSIRGFSRQSSKYLKKIYGEQMPPNAVSFHHSERLFDKKRPELLHKMKNCTTGTEAAKKKKVATSSKKSKALSDTVPASAEAKFATPKMVPSTIITDPAPSSTVDTMNDLTASNLLMQFGIHQKLPSSFVTPVPEQVQGHHAFDVASFSLLVQQEQLRQLQQEQLRQLQQEEEMKRQQENEQRVYAYFLQQELEQQRQAMMFEALLFEEQQNLLQRQQQMTGMAGNMQQHQGQDELLLIQLLQQQQQQQSGSLAYTNGHNC